MEQINYHYQSDNILNSKLFQKKQMWEDDLRILLVINIYIIKKNKIINKTPRLKSHGALVYRVIEQLKNYQKDIDLSAILRYSLWLVFKKLSLCC